MKFINTLKKHPLLLSFSTAIFVVFVFNAIFNPIFNDFVGYMVADGLGTSSIQMDLMTFIQMMLVLLVEISLIGGVFYYVTKRFFI
ncbi:hypothetical protein [Candidatus Absconditicoccus praedator]|uniref:hypothetical protein n=1 Tax=Candidatus Absconditicoccus praedator TaxID=2735562 RepID=UPI001E28B402|nr:hypothetical protein [Candidatus Absconditicoccus praedator]UFX82701.1 hypothetical protein HLG78_00930 [Candidatus Absconditicoccus praedator]